MNNIGPIRFKPYFKPVLWGGSRIAAFKGMEPNDAYEKSKGTYGRFNDAAKYINPRKD